MRQTDQGQHIIEGMAEREVLFDPVGPHPFGAAA